MKNIIVIIISIVCMSSVTHAGDKVVIAFPELPPLCSFVGGQPSGLQVEVAVECFKHLGIEYEIINLPWARCQEQAKMYQPGREVDLIITTPTKGRFEWAIFSKEMAAPYFCDVFVLKTKVHIVEAAKKFTSVEDVKPYKNLCFLGNGWREAFMPDEKGFQNDLAPTMELVARKLVGGRADLSVANTTAMRYYLSQINGLDQVEEIQWKVPFSRIDMKFQLSRKSPWVEKGLIKGLDQALRAIKDSGKYMEIMAKYKDPTAIGRALNSDIDTTPFYLEYDSYPEWKAKK